MKDSKAALRKRGREAYPRDPRAHALASGSIRDLIASAPAFQEASVVALFCGRVWEVELRPLWERRPAHCVFPRSNPLEKSMIFYRVESLEELQPGYAGIPEPPPLAERAVAVWKSKDLILVPGLLFDGKGRRIGSGHGYYDRFLAAVPARRWGVCFSTQITKETLAQEPTDVRMDRLVSEQGLLSVSAG